MWGLHHIILNIVSMARCLEKIQYAYLKLHFNFMRVKYLMQRDNALTLVYKARTASLIQMITAFYLAPALISCHRNCWIRRWKRRLMQSHQVLLWAPIEQSEWWSLNRSLQSTQRHPWGSVSWQEFCIFQGEFFRASQPKYSTQRLGWTIYHSKFSRKWSSPHSRVFNNIYMEYFGGYSWFPKESIISVRDFLTGRRQWGSSWGSFLSMRTGQTQ